MRITIGKAKRGLGSLLPGQAYVGRPSPLGNPFVVGRDGSREEVIANYRRWRWARLQELDSAQERELRRLLARAVAGELELLCWCHPLPCHTEVVRGAGLWLGGEESLDVLIRQVVSLISQGHFQQNLLCFAITNLQMWSLEG